MATDSNFYISMMKSTIATTDGSLDTCYNKFEELLVTTHEARMAWECFELPLRKTQIKRYYDQAKRFIEQDNQVSEVEAQSPITNPEDEVASASESSEEQQTRPRRPFTPSTISKQLSTIKSSVPIIRTSPRSGRSAQSAQNAIGILGREAAYDCFTDHRGTRLGNLTSKGLEVYVQQEVSVALRHYAQLLMQNMPQTTRSRDIVRNYVSKKLSGELWEKAQELAKAAA